MSSNCPYCGHPLKGQDTILPPMNKRKERIYNAVVAAGRKGVEVSELMRRMYDTQEPTAKAHGVMRVYICELNKVIARFNEKIVARNGSYFVLPVREP